MAKWSIERLHGTHEREEFASGKQELDEFLHKLVRQYEKRKLGRTYVAVPPGENRVLGYYTLASGAVSFQTLPEKARKKLPRHPVPVVLVARLAVDQSVQGQGLGAFLLTDALRRCRHLAEQLGVYAVEVHAIDDRARAFYQKYGFVALEDDLHHLYLPMAAVDSAFGGASD